MAPGGTRAVTSAATVVVAGGAGWALATGAWATALACLACGLAVAAGWVVVRHDPTSPVGPALAWASAAVALVTVHELDGLAGLPWANGIWPLNLAGVVVLLLVFPDGPLPGRPWRAPLVLIPLATAATVTALWGTRRAGGTLVDGPGGAWVMPLGLAGMALVAAAVLLAAASQAVRYRRGGRRTRSQLRWLLLAGLGVLALLVGGWAAELLGASLDVAYTPFVLAVVTLVPAAVLVAVVRHDLFDVDRLLSGTTAWAVTALASAGVFALVVLVVGRAVAVGTGVSGAVAAFVTALAILPLHQRLSTWIGRVVDRDRYVAVAAVEAFASDVRTGRRPPEEVEQVLRRAQGDRDLVVRLARPDGGWVRPDGTPDDGLADGVPVEAGGDVVAEVVLGWDSRRARRRLADLARAAWVPLEVARLRLVLREALAEAEASRARLAEAAADERRRLERDLHDGAQQRVLATGVRLRLLQARLDGDEAAEVDEAVRELLGTVEELRRLAQGVRPSRLDDGLAAALVSITRSTPLPVALEVDDVPALSDTRALTAYLVVSEAVANVLKHARASAVRVRVAAQDDRLVVEVSDDGVGGVATDAPLPALRDRVASVGGDLEVSSPPGLGTTVRAVL